MFLFEISTASINALVSRWKGILLTVSPKRISFCTISLSSTVSEKETEKGVADTRRRKRRERLNSKKGWNGI